MQSTSIFTGEKISFAPVICHSSELKLDSRERVNWNEKGTINSIKITARRLKGYLL